LCDFPRFGYNLLTTSYRFRMNITTPILMIIVLLVVLLILVFMLVARPSKKKHVQKRTIKQPPVEKKRVRSFDELVAVLKKKTSGADELRDALHEITGSYGKITPKLGARVHPDFDNYMLVILLICRHRNTNKNIILDFDRALSGRNPEYKREISDAVQKGLNSRG
ncbi:MAG: hypothetical protein U9Q62_03005, partial [Campylobacterota bacterium]|nr:hypothetical protein [Campylobacterota bacterium]